MKCQIFTLCEYVTNNDGRLTIVNTIDNISVEKFPWRTYFGIALKLLITFQDTCKSLTISISQKGDNPHTLFESTTPLPAKGSGKFLLAGNLKGFIFDQPGVYSASITSDSGEIIAETEFSVTTNQPTEQNNE